MSQDAGLSRPPYYVALDGLRAMAVLMVFCQHYGAGKVWIFGWGWTGVDVFFVLSGFLITGILYDSRDRPLRYRDFYRPGASRARGLKRSGIVDVAFRLQQGMRQTNTLGL